MYYLDLAVLLAIAMMAILAPAPGHLLLAPAPRRRPGWLRIPRSRRHARDLKEEAVASAWLDEVKDPRLRSARPPWPPAHVPAHVSPSMLAGEHHSQMWRAPKTPAAPPPAPVNEPPWAPGDDDPPTLVRVVRRRLADDLGSYLDSLPRYKD